MILGNKVNILKAMCKAWRIVKVLIWLVVLRFGQLWLIVLEAEVHIVIF